MAIKKTAGETYEKTTTKERYESDDPTPAEEGDPEEEPDPEAEDDEPEPEAEEDPEPDAEAEPEPEEEGDEPVTKAEDEPMPEDEGDEPEPEDDGDDEPTMKARTRSRRASPRAAAGRTRSDARTDGSLAEILGLRPGASQLAIKNAAMRMRSTLDRVSKELDVSSDAELIGAVKAVAQDAARLSKVEAQNRKLIRQERAERRMAAVKKLVNANLPGLTRGDLYIDTVDERTGKVTTKLAPEYQQMKLETLEGFVKRKLKSGGAPARRATPFDPDAKSAREKAALPNLESAKSHPPVVAAWNRHKANGGKQDLETFARAYAAQFPNQRGGGPRRG